MDIELEKRFNSADSLIKWFWEEYNEIPRCQTHGTKGMGFCECLVGEMVCNSVDQPVLMNSFLLMGVFIDQVMYKHFQSIYETFKARFLYPKLYGHVSFRMVSPSYFVYLSMKFLHKNVDWNLVLFVARLLLGDLYRWLEQTFPNGEELVKKLKSVLDIEAVIEFNKDSKFVSKVIAQVG